MEKQPLKIPYGISNFEKLVSQGYHFVDRTGFISKIENQSRPYLVFLRPRRFGKSLLLSMLNYYYGSVYRDRFEVLFGGYEVGRNPTPLRNSYAILHFDFSGINTDNHESAVCGFSSNVRNSLYSFLTGFFPDLHMEEDLPSVDTGAEAILDYVLSHLANRTPQKVYLLIDEYDHFANEILSFRYDDYLKSVAQNGFVRKFFEKIKTYTQTGLIDRLFITGVSPITLDSLTSGFNISTSLSLEPEFHGMCGFTQEESLALIAHFYPQDQVEGVMEDCRRWYNGYRFCKDVEERIFNPDMVLYFLCHVAKDGRYPDEMLDMNIASDYTKIARQFNIHDRKANLQELYSLVQDREVFAPLTRGFSLQKKFDRGDFISLLFYGGILTIEEVQGLTLKFRMPNLVLEKLYLEFFVREIAERSDFKIDVSKLEMAIWELSQKREVRLLLNLVEDLLKSLSFRDFMAFEEKYVKAIIYSYISLSQLYLVKSEYELPMGYADLVLFKRSPYLEVKHQFIFELKYCKIHGDKPEKNPDQLARQGQEQLLQYMECKEIRDRLADESCPLSAWVLVFCGPECRVCEQVLPG